MNPQAAAPPKSAYRWLVLGAATSAQAAASFAMLGLAALAGFLQQEFHLSAAKTGLLITANGAAVASGSHGLSAGGRWIRTFGPPSAATPLSDRYSPVQQSPYGIARLACSSLKSGITSRVSIRDESSTMSLRLSLRCPSINQSIGGRSKPVPG
jgi:hypothetical protein